jgi:hypothetical protein
MQPRPAEAEPDSISPQLENRFYGNSATPSVGLNMRTPGNTPNSQITGHAGVIGGGRFFSSIGRFTGEPSCSDSSRLGAPDNALLGHDQLVADRLFPQDRATGSEPLRREQGNVLGSMTDSRRLMGRGAEVPFGSPDTFRSGVVGTVVKKNSPCRTVGAVGKQPPLAAAIPENQQQDSVGSKWHQFGTEGMERGCEPLESGLGLANIAWTESPSARLQDAISPQGVMSPPQRSLAESINSQTQDFSKWEDGGDGGKSMGSGCGLLQKSRPSSVGCGTTLHQVSKWSKFEGQEEGNHDDDDDSDDGGDEEFPSTSDTRQYQNVPCVQNLLPKAQRLLGKECDAASNSACISDNSSTNISATETNRTVALGSGCVKLAVGDTSRKRSAGEIMALLGKKKAKLSDDCTEAASSAKPESFVDVDAGDQTKVESGKLDEGFPADDGVGE